MCREELVNFHAGVEAKQTADFGFDERAGTIAFEGEGFERGTGGVLAGGGELCGEGVRDFEGHLHGLTIHFWVFCGGAEEGNFVVSAAPALRPSAERKRLRRGCVPRATPWAGIASRFQRLDCWVVEERGGLCDPHPEHDGGTVMIGAPLVLRV
jgi:hypothetical protein